MKKAIHPKNTKLNIVCASCSNSFSTISTKGISDVTIDICSNCHPFYIGSKQQTSIRGRAEKMSSKFEAAKNLKSKPIEVAKKDTKVKKEKISLKDLGKLS